MKNVKLVIAEPQSFTDSIGSINKLVEETNIVVKPTHIEVVAMDPANVAMVIFKMQASEFVEYSVEEEATFGLKLSTLKQVLSRGNKDNILTLVFSDNLKVMFSGKTKKDFTLPLIDTGNKPQKIPDLKFNAEITLDNSELRDAIADVSIMGESCNLTVEADKFVISGSGDTGNKAITETKGSISLIDKSKPAKSKYSIEYIDKMVATKLSKTAKVFLGSDYPLKLHYANDKGSISIDFILAPRVDND